jgi:hypothetical protein
MLRLAFYYVAHNEMIYEFSISGNYTLAELLRFGEPVHAIHKSALLDLANSQFRNNTLERFKYPYLCEQYLAAVATVSDH